MLRSAKLAKVIVITVVNKVGVLADITKILAGHGINIEAAKGYAEDAKAKIMLVTDDNLRAVDALKKKDYKSIVENEVIMIELENKAGALKNVALKLESEEIDIKYIFATTCSTGCPVRLVLSTSDDEKALVAFNK
jgi:hypothetical protein